MSTLSFEIVNGSIEVGVTILEMADGTLRFDINVLENTGVIGDLNGLFFDLADDSLTDMLTVSGVDVTGENIDANSVTKVDGFNNVNGEVVKEDGKFDIGVQFGTQGMATDDIQSTSFFLGTSDGTALSLDDIYDQDFAVRLTSVGEVDGVRNDSVKISGTSDGEIVNPDPEPPTSANQAVNDSMTVSKNETFSDFGLPDPLDDFQFTLLGNDTTDGTDPYSGDVIMVNGQLLVDGLILDGSNGGLLIANADGTVDFSANNDFDYLSGDQTAQTQFSYTIEGGSTATLDVTVFASVDGGGGGIGPLF